MMMMMMAIMSVDTGDNIEDDGMTTIILTLEWINQVSLWVVGAIMMTTMVMMTIVSKQDDDKDIHDFQKDQVGVFMH